MESNEGTWLCGLVSLKKKGNMRVSEWVLGCVCVDVGERKVRRKRKGRDGKKGR